VFKTTIIITSHDIGDIESLCRRIIVVDKGKAIFDGPINRFNYIFGAYRTLKINFSKNNQSLLSVKNKTKEKFNNKNSISIEEKTSGWLDLVIDQTKVELIDVLNYLLKEFCNISLSHGSKQTNAIDCENKSEAILS
jgi:ABC-2 type transport system ATP-binding protein